MHRRMMMTAVVGVLAAGFGCRHVGGKCDCGAHPADAVITPATPPYPTAPAPGLTPGAVTPIPPAGVGAKVETKAIPDTLPVQTPKR